MPGRPTPTRRTELLSGHDPRAGTVYTQAPRAGSQAETSRAIEQLDRRLARQQPPREPVWVQPDSPGWALGRLWYDTDSTADNP